ncbi:MAG: hypothetical protein IKU13_09015 [Clostridia bacterium]|nr:hypothetical protein [Clostridia bacterium]
MFGVVFGATFMAVWYKMGEVTVADRKNIILSGISINILPLIFLISAFIHENIIGWYIGIIGELTQNYYIPGTFIGTEILGLLGMINGTYTGEVCVAGSSFETDVVYFILLLICFIAGVMKAKTKKN